MQLRTPVRTSMRAAATAFATLAATCGMAALGTVTAHAAASSPATPAHVFAPYWEAYSGDDPLTEWQASGDKYMTAAFLQTASSGSCTADWNGSTSQPIAQSTFGSQIATIQADGGNIIPSFGGYTADTTNTDIADSCTNVSSIAAAYESLISTYNINRIDLDVEADSDTNTAGITRRNQAIAQTEAWAAANGHTIQFSYTLPVEPSGLPSDEVAILQNAITEGATIATVNIMTFDYYIGTNQEMATDTEQSASALEGQLHSLYPSLSTAQLWEMIGVTEMEGIDDYGSGETFTEADASTVLSWAQTQGIGELSMWAVERDNGGCVGTGGSDSCSGISQNTWFFSNKFEPFTSGTTVTNGFSVAVSPTSGSVKAGSSATATVSTAVTSGSAQSVALTSSGAPSGVTVSFSPASVTAGSSSTVTFATTSATAAGTYPITIKGTAASGSQTATYNLTVTSGTSTNGFSVAVSPTSGSVAAGSSATATVSTAVTSGSAQSVALTSSGAPSGVTVSFSPASVTAGSSSTVTFATTSATAAGTYPITIKGTATSGSQTATYNLTVTSGTTPPPGSIVNPGFETGSLSPWVCQSGDSISTTTVHSGKDAALIVPTSSATGACDQSVTLSPNHSYTLTAWVEGNYAFVGVSGGATASTWTSTSTWKQLSVPFTTGSSGAVTVYVNGWYGQGNVYADDFAIS